MPINQKHRYLILGASSWVGHYLIAALQRRSPGCQIAGTYNKHRPNLDIPLSPLSSMDTEAARVIFADFKPTVTINLLRGETEQDFEWHRYLMKQVSNCGGYYLYGSSANAVDFNLDQPHSESEPSKAQSAYGMFKSRCEEELLSDFPHYGIIRFAAIHGWAPNRLSRTEEFLLELSKGSTLSFPRGIIQNRLSDKMLATMIAEIATCRGVGIYHLGTIDNSDEVDFRRRLAQAFGYLPDQIQETAGTPCNLVMIPNKIFEISQTDLRFSESDTISEVAKTSELKRYLKQHNLRVFSIVHS